MPSTQTSLPATDQAALDRLRRFGGGKLLGEMIALFLAAAPERLGLARAAAARGDAKDVELALHSLKSSAAQLGALQMQRLSDDGEQRARLGDLGAIPRLLEALDEEHARVREWLVRARDEATA